MILLHLVRNWRKGSLKRHSKGSAFAGCTGKWRRYRSEGRNIAIMCGGSHEVFQGEPMLQNLGDKIKYFGPAGSGQQGEDVQSDSDRIDNGWNGGIYAVCGTGRA